LYEAKASGEDARTAKTMERMIADEKMIGKKSSSKNRARRTKCRLGRTGKRNEERCVDLPAS
jgi:hypothetical protein